MTEGIEPHWNTPAPPYASWGVLGYRCQFKCDTLQGAVKCVSKGTRYGSPYETHFYCRICEMFFPHSVYDWRKKCPCCAHHVRKKGNAWHKLWNKPEIKYID